MDVYVLLDAIAKCMSSEESELNKVHTTCTMYTMYMYDDDAPLMILEYMMYIHVGNYTYISETKQLRIP